MNINVIIISVMAVIVAGGYLFFAPRDNSSVNTANAGIFSGYDAIEYKSPTCGCCVEYSKEAGGLGMNIDIVKIEDMDAIKRKYNIPKEMESCHTLVIRDYFIEGHVPFEAVEKLLTEKPDIDGIALPDMPAGTPGMPGVKNGTWKIYQLKNGEYSVFTEI